MVKGAISLIAIVGVCWFLWMSWLWLRPKKETQQKKEEE